MNCPYCDTVIPGLTGLQDAQLFTAHLNHCPKKPVAVVANTDADGRTRVERRPFVLGDALELRAKSGQ